MIEFEKLKGFLQLNTENIKCYRYYEYYICLENDNYLLFKLTIYNIKKNFYYFDINELKLIFNNKKYIFQHYKTLQIQWDENTKVNIK